MSLCWKTGVPTYTQVEGGENGCEYTRNIQKGIGTVAGIPDRATAFSADGRESTCSGRESVKEAQQACPFLWGCLTSQPGAEQKQQPPRGDEQVFKHT